MAIDLLTIARQGVLASQTQLGVTGNNIANLNTEGYHRQAVDQSAAEAQKLGRFFVGTGAYINDVRRIFDEFAFKELRYGQTMLSQAESEQLKLGELDQLFSKMGSSVPQSLNALYSDLANLADLPDDLGVRQGVLNSAKQLTNTINQMQLSLDGQFDQTNQQIESAVQRINEIGTELSNINGELAKTSGENLSLLDRQELLIRELSQYAKVNAIDNGQQMKSIMLGGNVTLVSGQQAIPISVTQGDVYTNEIGINYQAGTQEIAINGQDLGGQLGALFNFRDGTLLSSGLKLGKLALGLASEFNAQQALGIDLNGNVGGILFTDINQTQMNIGRVASLASNIGNAQLSIEINDTSLLTADSYQLDFTAPTTFNLTNNRTGVIQNLTLNGTNLITQEGFELNIDSGTLASGDSFSLRPTAGAAIGIDLALTTPESLAAAKYSIIEDANNPGNISVKLTSVDNRNAINFPTNGSEVNYFIDTAANQYTVFDVDGNLIQAATNYTPPNITDFGFTIEVITDGASVGSFTFDLSYSVGDNRNALAMATKNETAPMDAGSSSFTDVFENIKLDIGSKANTAKVSFASAESIYQQAFDRVEQTSGVNLDEEAANLIRFQQSYQAAARIMSTSQQLFNSLINAFS